MTRASRSASALSPNAFDPKLEKLNQAHWHRTLGSCEDVWRFQPCVQVAVSTPHLLGRPCLVARLQCIMSGQYSSNPQIPTIDPCLGHFQIYLKCCHQVL